MCFVMFVINVVFLLRLSDIIFLVEKKCFNLLFVFSLEFINCGDFK